MRRLHEDVGGAIETRWVISRAHEPHAAAEAVAVDERSPWSAGVPGMPRHVRTNEREQRVASVGAAPRLEQVHDALLAAQASNRERDQPIRGPADRIARAITLVS